MKMPIPPSLLSSLDEESRALLERADILFTTDLANNLIDIVEKQGFLVVDENTVKLLNPKVMSEVTHYILTDAVASEETVEIVRQKSAKADFLIAFGSGTISDICKYASYLDNKSYVVCPTAASMNGYLSANASIRNKKGQHISVAAHLPKAVYVDMDIIFQAPLRLTLSGFADFMCRSTAQADWLLSSFLLDTDYNELPFVLIKEIEGEVIDTYKGLLRYDQQSISILMKALLLSGTGMTIAKSSHPASQGEHIIAQTMDLLSLTPYFHGEKIGVTTLTMIALQNRLLSAKPFVTPTSITEYEVWEFFKRDEMVEKFNNKKISQEMADKINNKIYSNWHEIEEKIRTVMLPPQLLSKLLHNLGAPTTPQDLEWNQSIYEQAIKFSFITKDRFTFLDLNNYVE